MAQRDGTFHIAFLKYLTWSALRVSIALAMRLFCFSPKHFTANWNDAISVGDQGTTLFGAVC